MPLPARLAVFASGGGTNFQALLDHFNAKGSDLARVELLIASREGIGAIARADAAGVAVRVIDPAGVAGTGAGPRMLEVLASARIDFIALAGYLKLIPSDVVEAYHDRIINIHPALLPAFGGSGMYGGRVHRAVLASGATVSGATVHLVDARYDEGRIIAQWPVPVLSGDTAESLAARVLRVEHLLYPLALEHFLAGPGGSFPDGIPPADDSVFELRASDAPSLESMRQILRHKS